VKTNDDSRDARVKQFLDERRRQYVAELGALVAVPCGTEMVEGVNHVVSIVAARLAGLGMNVRRVPAKGYGDHLIATTGVEGRQIVLGGHLDTTYTDYSVLPAFHVDGDHAVGPGASDMKGGVVICLAALDCLKDAGELGTLPITVLLNSDEERGAPTSRAIFEEFAPRTKAALFCECGGPNGELVIARRGKLSYRIDAVGENMHAGEGTGPRRSAILDLSHRIIALEALNGRFADTSINVGRVWGGVASNTVPGEAVALMDIRFPRADIEREIRAAVSAICAAAHVDGVACTAAETSYRPVWDRPEISRPLAELAARISGEQCRDVMAVPRGGTADSNWFGAAGVPTLDGLGAIGSDEHTGRERTHLGSLFERARLLASLLPAIDKEFPA